MNFNNIINKHILYMWTTAARIIGMKFRSFEFNTNVGKEGEALRCKIGPTFYQKIMLHIE
jgi:hypothetical protein